MDFSSYLPFDHEFKKKFDWLYDEYPYAMMLFEKQLRNAEGGYEDLAKQNARGAGRTSLRRMLQVYYALWRMPISNSPQYYLSLERFEGIQSGLTETARLLELQLLTGNRNFNKVATLGAAYPKFMRIVFKYGFTRALEDRKLLTKLENQSRKNFEKVKLFLIKANVRLFIADGDTLPHARFYCQAAREIGAPYIVFSHGYVQDRQLLSIAPIHADYHITWTEQQRNDLASAIDPSDAQKVLFFGYPKAHFQSEPVKNLALIAWNSLVDSDRDAEISAITSLVKRARSEGYDIRLRLHPKDKKDQALMRQCELLDLEISKNTLDVDIRDAEVVLGSYSSVMIEAAMSGKKVLQLAECSEYTFENVPLLQANESIRQALKHTAHHSRPQLFDHKKFEQFLRSVLTYP